MAADALLLGANGTFGHVAARIFARHDTIATAREASGSVIAFDVTKPDADLETLLERIKPGGLIVNAVAVPASDVQSGAPAASHERALAINALFPHRLARLAGNLGQRVVHISTDAVFASNPDGRSEFDPLSPQDFYAVSKLAGELSYPHTLTIRCSLVGPPAPGRARGLWAWIAGAEKNASIRGYTNHIWSGVTTRQLAEACVALVDAQAFARARQHGAIHHLAPNAAVSKYELVRAIAACVRPDLVVEALRADTDVCRVLASRIGALNGLTPHYRDWAAAIDAAAHQFQPTT